MKNHPIQMNFTSGELSPRLKGRVDLDQYRGGLETMENFTPMPHGGCQFRQGFHHVYEVKDSADDTRLIPFQFSREQAYILEFGDQYVRFFKDHGIIVGDHIAVGNGGFETAGTGGFSIWVETVGDGAIARTVDETAWEEDAHATLTAGATGNTKIANTVIHGLSATDVATLRFYTRSPDGSPGRYGVYDNQNTSYIVAGSTGVTSSEWTLFEIQFGIPSGCTSVNIELNCPATNTHEAEFDWVTFHNDQVPLEISTPYAHEDLAELQWTQSADVLYLVHPDYQPRKLNRYSHYEWELETITFVGPNTVKNGGMDADAFWKKGTGWDISTGVAICDGTQTANSDLHQEDVNEIGVSYTVKFTVLNHSAGSLTPYCGTTAGTTVSANGEYEQTITQAGNDHFYLRADSAFIADVDDVEVTTTMFDDTDDYPRCVTFFEERLFFAATNNQPQTIWGSESGNYQTFVGGVDDDDSIQYTIASDQVNVINWLSPSTSLIVGTAGGEFKMDGGSEPIVTPSAVSVQSVSTNGAAEGIKAVRISNVILFVQTAGKKLIEYKYDFKEDSYIGTNLTLISEHITGDGISEIAYQREPDSIVWGVRPEDGTLVSMTYERNNEVIAWARHTVGGVDAEVKSIACIPSPDGLQDDLWAIIERTIDSSTVQYVEYLDAEAHGMDSFLKWDGSPTDTFTGADHLEGEEVVIIGDGALYPSETVSGGSFTIDGEDASVVYAGLSYDGELKTNKPNVEGQEGHSYGFIKGWNRIKLMVYDSLGGEINGQDLLLVDPQDKMGQGPNMYTGMLDVTECGWDDEAQIVIKQIYPFPFTLLMITGSLNIAEEM